MSQLDNPQDLGEALNGKTITINGDTQNLEDNPSYSIPQGDIYKTTSATSNTISSTGSKTFTVDLGLAYIPMQDVIIVYNSSNHMHGTITSYNDGTGEMIVDIQNKTGSGTYSSWTINLDAIAASTSPLTTKGDLYTFGAADARLPVGTNNYFLVPDSAQTLGLKWFNLFGTANTFTATQTNSQSTTTTPVDAWIASTSATATAGNQKASTAIKWTASGWKTDSTSGARQIDWRAFVLPEQGTSNPSSLWKLQSQTNNGGYSDRIIVDDKVGGVGFKILTSGSNSSPGTTRAMTIENSGSTSWLDWTFSGVRKSAIGANSSGGIDMYFTGGNYLALFNSSNNLYSYNYPTAFVHSSGGGWFYDRVSAGSASNPSSTLASAGSVALGKGKRVTSNYTLTVDDSAIYADASAAACSGTPTYSCSHWTNQTDCEKWDAHGGCTWFAGDSCSVYNGDSGSCNGTSGCTWDEASCSGAGDQSSCEAQDDSYGGSCSWGGFTASSCSGTVTDCTQWNGDETTCNANSLFCAWDGMGGCYNTITDCGTWNSDGSNCSAAGCSFTPEVPDSCSGTYYTGNCSGTYGAACSGTSACAGIDDSTNCGNETGCTWSTAITLNLPQVTTCPHRDYWIYNDSSSSADVIITPYSGDQIDKTTSYTLTTYKDAIHIKAFYELTSCGSFNEGACTPSGCSPTYSNCSWDSMESTCSGNAVCTGIGDQGTCESTTYFSSCSGSYYTIKNWYLLSRS